jgi:hypothetical protein
MAFCCGIFGAPCPGWPISTQYYTFFVIAGDEGNAGGSEGTVDSMARFLAHLERVGLQALERGQGYQGLVGEHLLRPSKERTCSPHLARGDHS